MNNELSHHHITRVKSSQEYLNNTKLWLVPYTNQRLLEIMYYHKFISLNFFYYVSQPVCFIAICDIYTQSESINSEASSFGNKKIVKRKDKRVFYLEESNKWHDLYLTSCYQFLLLLGCHINQSGLFRALSSFIVKKESYL